MLSLLLSLHLACLIPTGEAKAPGYVAHEWGTFTTVADDEGRPLGWRPLSVRSDLPPFVYQVVDGGKSRMVVPVRMETPVIYFYPDAPMKVSAKVRFPQGRFTEWFPAAAVDAWSAQELAWPEVWLGVEGEEPASAGPSHYLPAREVDAALVGVGDERERFLFYRGVAAFAPTQSFRLRGDRVEAVGGADRPFIVFERDGDRSRFVVVEGGDGVSLAVARAGDVRPALQEALVDAGLFPGEALAMVRSWEGDWFEEGLRVFWLYRPEEVEAILPLELSPAPKALVRVLVGRTELIPPEDRAEALAIARSEPEDLTAALEERFGRFAMPTATLAAGGGGPEAEALLGAVRYARGVASDVVD